MLCEVGGKMKRMGYTTGSCAAAAAKGAVLMLKTKKILEQVEIDTPAGCRLCLLLEDVHIEADEASCAVRKDGGDDPDVTHGLLIYAKAEFCPFEKILVTAGEGIGIVTKKGLSVLPGLPAINPGPMSMILHEVSQIYDEGIKITLWAPKGEEIAKKTFNPRLGIVGGISIIGTTGIVKPMSQEAWRDSAIVELKERFAESGGILCFVAGGIGETFAKETLQIDGEKIVMVSNFMGELLDAAEGIGVKKLLIAGHMGKIVKLAAGIFQTHSSMADGRMITLCALAALSGAPTAFVKELYSCVTTDAAIEILEKQGFMEAVCNLVVQEAQKRCMERIHHQIEIYLIIFDSQKRILAQNTGIGRILPFLKEEKDGK